MFIDKVICASPSTLLYTLSFVMMKQTLILQKLPPRKYVTRNYYLFTDTDQTYYLKIQSKIWFCIVLFPEYLTFLILYLVNYATA
jgi:hypothetical protein